MDQSQVQQQKETEFQQLLKQWEDEHQTNGYDPHPFLIKVAEFIEHETELFLKMDPDPFDDRHPSRVDPSCGLGFALKYLFRKENFMTKLVNDYLRDTFWSRQNMGIPGDQRSFELNVAACRVLLGIMPGLDTSAVFQDMDTQILKLFSWAENAAEPLQSYATGMLAAAMEVSDIAANFREQNAKLVPLMLKRLHDLQQEHLKNAAKEDSSPAASRPFAHLGHKSSPSSPSKLADTTSDPPLKKKKCIPPFSETSPTKSGSIGAAMQYSSLVPPHSPNNSPKLLNGDQSPPFRRLSTDILPSSPAKDPVNQRVSMTNDCSNSSWAEMESFVIGSFQMYPVTLATKQILILRYLTPVGEYQEFLGFVFEHNAMQLILKYTNLKESHDARLAFEALKYLGALLCHKKFSFEFIISQRMQHLMNIRRPSIAACGVAMCLYHMSYCEDTMERICLLPHYIIRQVVRYALWLLECSHDSSRCHAVMFFILALPFYVILEEFDYQDGLRKVYNVVSTQALLSSDDSRHLNEDEQCAARQIIRHSFMCFKRYFETHLALRADTMSRLTVHQQSITTTTTTTSDSDQVLQTVHTYKPLRPTSEQVQEYVNTLLELMSIRAHWAPVDKFINLGGIALLLKVIAYAYEWNYSGRAETVRSALDTLAVCAVMPKAQLQLCDKVDLPFDSISMGMNIILGAAEGEIVADADVQRSALHVIANCVCAPEHRMGSSAGKFAVQSSKKKAYMRNSEDVIAKMWDSVRTNNGIMVLLQLMTVKARLTEADSIRMLACRALAGLARSETVRQIIGKLTLVTDGQLQILMRDPILQDRRQEHVQFQKYAVQLLERVSGKPGCNELEASVQHIHRANVVAQTRIQYNEQHLYQLIHEHLLNKGLTNTAKQLKEEAHLPDPPPASQTPARPTPASAFPSIVSHRGGIVSAPSTPTTSRLVSRVGRTPRKVDNQTTPIKLSLNASRRAESTRKEPSRVLQKQTSYENNPTLAGSSPENKIKDFTNSSSVSLEGIVTEYLKNQHALCKNPVTTCPQFNLFKPHKCPDPRDRSKVTVNFAMRLPQRHIWPPKGGPEAGRLDRRLIHSRFCPVKTFRLGKEDAFFTCAAFDPQDQRLLLGTFEGQMKMFNLQSGSEEASYQCHDSYVYRLEPSRDGKLLLTSSTWRRPLSALFSLGQFFQMQYPFDEEEYVEFSKVTQSSIIGTKAEVASIYDVETGRKLSTLRPEISNNYTKNRATYSPTDELVLSDGVLWDVGANKPIHKFDKLNQTLSGVFHPNGLEVVSNTEVWDLRTFHLLRTVPALDQCELRFTPRGDVLYCASMEAESDEDSSFESSFKTLDAKDYSSIATIDVKRNIYDLALNNAGTQLALVENQGMFESVQESSTRLYDIGRKRDDEDEGEEEDDEDNMDGSNDDGSSSSSLSDDDNDAIRGAGDEGDRGEAGGREQEDGDQSSVDSDWETQSSAHGSNNDSDISEDDDDSIVSRIFANLLNDESP